MAKQNFIIEDKKNSTRNDNEFWEWRKCPICGQTFFVRKKYSKICCSECCTKKYQSIHKEEINIKRSASLKETNKNKTIEEKRVELAKAKETCLKRYGVDMYQKTEEYKKKMSEHHKAKDWSYRTAANNVLLEKKYRDICENDNLELLEFNGRFDCKVRCKVCGTVFVTHILGYLQYSTTHNLCRKCHPVKYENNITSPFKKIESLLTSEGIKFTENDRTIIHPFEIDFLIEEKNIGIEVNGNYWHSEDGGGKDKNYHLYKTEEANKKGIRLIHIFEDEIEHNWENTKHFVLSALNDTNCPSFRRIDEQTLALDVAHYGINPLLYTLPENYTYVGNTAPSYRCVCKNNYLREWATEKDGDTDKIWDCGQMLFVNKKMGTH